MASRLFLRSAVLQLRRSFNGGGLPLPNGGGFSRLLDSCAVLCPRTGQLVLPGADRFFSKSSQSSAWFDWDYTCFVSAVLPVFIVDRYQNYKLEKRLKELESAADKLYESYVQKVEGN